jgi:hypothetical protein
MERRIRVVLRIRTLKDPQHFAGSGSATPLGEIDLDPTYYCGLFSRVVDPELFFSDSDPDSDPALTLISDPDLDCL